ncbi:LysE family translocator [Martelella mediterranea]|uniref:Homoserine/homoserine lactone efflux protein n=1 Tax=Martelella mediterranea DSM 17316 TaxID=1122214 RepID=A0A1U9Z176_9HYPH|nr:LysE family translocator [Martelella mediterranea]AQZ51434.1 Homoserine/homoserine lactone efflux protein [Martelella mediterranea DSM 17316]
MSIEFLITALIVVLAPGTGVVYTLATGLAQGRMASVAAALGCTLGIIPAILASVFGLAALFHTSALLFQTVKFAGVAYLLYLAWQTLKDRGAMRVSGEGVERRNLFQIARNGFLINILNPKLSIFFLAFLPQFVSPAAASPVLEMLAMSAVFMAMTFAVFVVYGQFSGLMRDRVLSSERAMAWMRRSVALAFAGFGLKLALSSR